MGAVTWKKNKEENEPLLRTRRWRPKFHPTPKGPSGVNLLTIVNRLSLRRRPIPAQP